MSRVVKMETVKCSICGKPWQAPSFVKQAADNGIDYKCPLCMRKEAKELAKQYQGRLMP